MVYEKVYETNTQRNSVQKKCWDFLRHLLLCGTIRAVFNYHQLWRFSAATEVTPPCFIVPHYITYMKLPCKVIFLNFFYLVSVPLCCISAFHLYKKGRILYSTIRGKLTFPLYDSRIIYFFHIYQLICITKLLKGKKKGIILKS